MKDPPGETLASLEAECSRHAETVIDQHPDTPATQLVELLAAEIGPETLNQLALFLVNKFLIATLRDERRKISQRNPANTAPYLFPGWDELPKTLPSRARRRRRLESASL